MSVTIRLSLVGKKNHPVYRIVVAEKRSKRNGRQIDTLGIYNPNATPPALNFDAKKLEEWQKKGAIISQGLSSILNKEKK